VCASHGFENTKKKPKKRTKFPGHSHLEIPGKSRNHLPSLNAEKRTSHRPEYINFEMEIHQTRDKKRDRLLFLIVRQFSFHIDGIV
jgi:hypothetical protein